MRKLLLLTYLICFFAPVLTGQNSILIDSLEHKIQGSVGKTRTDLLNELGWELKFTNPDSTLLLTREALTLAKSQSYNKGLALANRNMAAVNIIQGKMAEALPFAEKALIQIESLKEPYHKAKILNLLGVIHRDRKNFKKALDFQSQALVIFRQIKDTFEIAGNLNNLGLIYKELGNSDEALNLYLEVYDLEVRRKNPFGISRTSNNIASIYQEMKRFDKAEQMFRVSIIEARAINNKQFEAASIHGLGLLYQETGKPEKAIAEYRKAIEINRQAGFREYLGNNLMQLASSYSSINNYKEAFQRYSEASTVYSELQNPWNQALALSGMAWQQLFMNNLSEADNLAMKAMKIGDSLNDITVLADVNFILYKIHKESGSSLNALDYLEAYVNNKDSLQKVEKNQLLEEIQTRYEVKNIEDDNARLVAENQYQQQVIRNQRIITFAIIIILLMISSLAIVVLTGRKKLKVAYNELTEKNSEIQKQADLLHASNATKDKLFSIIAHDIRNPFSALLNLSEMLYDEAETADKETLRFYAGNIYQSARNTFQLLDNLLFWSKSQRGAIEIKPELCHLHKVINSVFETVKAGAMENNIQLHNEVEADESLNTDVTLLRIILGNLVGNAVKFNNPGGNITVSAIRNQKNLTLSVKDSGKGISPERLARLFSKEESFQPSGSRAQNGTGLGLILCHDFVEKLGGKITVESETDKGTEFLILLPTEFNS